MSVPQRDLTPMEQQALRGVAAAGIRGRDARNLPAHARATLQALVRRGLVVKRSDGLYEATADGRDVAPF